MKDYADAKAYVQPSNIKEGDSVVVKPTFVQSKSQTPYNKDKLIVTSKNGSMITASRERKETTRNSSFFKKLSNTANSDVEESDDDDDVRVCADQHGKMCADGSDMVLGGDTAVQPPVDATVVSGRPKRIHKPPPWLKDYVTLIT